MYRYSPKQEDIKWQRKDVFKKISQDGFGNGYQTEGAAKANIFCFIIAYSNAEGAGIDKPGEDSCVTILTLSFMRPAGVAGEAEEAGEVELDRQGEGVSGVVGGVIYDCDGWIDDRGMGLGGEH